MSNHPTRGHGGSRVPLFQRMIAKLMASQGAPAPPAVTDPMGMVLWENVAYLVDDEKRAAAFEMLRLRIGLTAGEIMTADPKELYEVALAGGMVPDLRVRKLVEIARIVIHEFDGDLDHVLQLPFRDAVRKLKKFPGIGDPGAEKILLFGGAYPVMSLDSNCLRVVTRIGYGDETKSYTATYRSAQAALKDEVVNDCLWLTDTYQILQRHGREVCRRTKPLCSACAVAEHCRYRTQQLQAGIAPAT